MANIGVRSPYFIYWEENGTTGGLSASYATLTLTVAGTQQYQITKNTGTKFLLDIAELVRDFVNPYYQGTLSVASSGSVPISYSLQFYNSANSPVGSAKTGTHTAFEAYHYFSEGNSANTSSSDSGFVIPSSRVLLSGSVIWYPENTAGVFFYTNSGGTVLPFTFNATSNVVTPIAGTDIYIRRLPCTKYETAKLVFINKYGILQDLYFTAKTSESISISSEKYKSGFTSETGSLNVFRHQRSDYNKNATVNYTLNTTFVCEGITNYIQELLLSEYVWLQKNGDFYPVNVKSSGIQYKTSVNDKLVNYTIDVEQANDLISTVR